MSVNSELGGDSSSNLSDISDASGTRTDGKILTRSYCLMNIASFNYLFLSIYIYT